MNGIQDIVPSDFPLEEVEDHFFGRGLKRVDGDYSGDMLEFLSAVDCEVDHFIIPPVMWKANGEESVKDGEYQYWQRHIWGQVKSWGSVRESIVNHVQYIEEMIEEGMKEADDDYNYDDDTDDSE